jgi:hypothetical protein
VTLQWAEHFICAAHRAPLGGLHGHTWRVRAHWSRIINAEDRKAQIVAACQRRCHGVLEGAEASAEGLAKTLGVELEADRVDVWREAEGLGAKWVRE